MPSVSYPALDFDSHRLEPNLMMMKKRMIERAIELRLAFVRAVESIVDSLSFVDSSLHEALQLLASTVQLPADDEPIDQSTPFRC